LGKTKALRNKISGF
jgi:hypothetical protein